jgi:hypothetical protein
MVNCSVAKKVCTLLAFSSGLLFSAANCSSSSTDSCGVESQEQEETSLVQIKRTVVLGGERAEKGPFDEPRYSGPSSAEAAYDNSLVDTEASPSKDAVTEAKIAEIDELEAGLKKAMAENVAAEKALYAKKIKSASYEKSLAHRLVADSVLADRGSATSPLAAHLDMAPTLERPLNEMPEMAATPEEMMLANEKASQMEQFKTYKSQKAADEKEFYGMRAAAEQAYMAKEEAAKKAALKQWQSKKVSDEAAAQALKNKAFAQWQAKETANKKAELMDWQNKKDAEMAAFAAKDDSRMSARASLSGMMSHGGYR